MLNILRHFQLPKESSFNSVRNRKTFPFYDPVLEPTLLFSKMKTKLAIAALPHVCSALKIMLVSLVVSKTEKNKSSKKTGKWEYVPFFIFSTKRMGVNT